VLDSGQIAALHRYLDLLLIANQQMNLTRISDRAAAELLHVADALTLLPHLPPKAHRLADVGSGGGVPGLVLAIARPDSEIVLIESTRKKAEFLNATIKELGLANASVLPLRAEDVGNGKMRESFDIVVARAVGLLPVLVEWLLPLVKVGGYALTMKGPKASEELEPSKRPIKALGGGNSEVLAPQLQGAEGHVIIKIPKIARTPAKFPRNPAQAKGKPI
jgi:16S rRNA (guanine527-N7)-methyltransferase